MIDDAELLRRYAAEGSEPAFTELVSRNVDLVYAAALRHVADEHRAKDIAQTVFVDLARKARSLCHHPALASWLFTSTRYAALKALRSERRRQIREHEAHFMQHVSSSSPTPDWERLRPVLDEVMDTLGACEREVVVLRYFRGLPFAELAGQLKVNEGALRMRVDRALDKMSALLAKRGISSTATALGLALSSQPLVAAPVGLAASVSGIAVTTTTAGGLGTLLIMSKTKIALVSLLLCGGIATAVVEYNRSRSPQAILATLDRLTRENAALRNQNTILSREAGELRRQQAEDSKNSARNAAVPTQPAAPSVSGFDGPLGNLKLLAEATKRGLVGPPRYFAPSGPFVLLEPFVKAFALTSDEVAALKVHMAQAESKINALTVANATAA
ncbi:MAG: sigma-70 family RNA polymerase sigma factor, partial [Opitutaceae bacterium]